MLTYIIGVAAVLGAAYCLWRFWLKPRGENPVSRILARFRR
jgi:hypothetical protein